METILLFFILAMPFHRCRLCRESPVRLSRTTFYHIIDEHFCRGNVDTFSTFYRDISFEMVFERFKAQFRDGTLEEELPRSWENPTFYCRFDFVVGSSPLRNGRGRWRSRYVRVPCVRLICPNCSHIMIKMKTAFPDGQRKPIDLKNNLMKRKSKVPKWRTCYCSIWLSRSRKASQNTNNY